MIFSEPPVSGRMDLSTFLARLLNPAIFFKRITREMCSPTTLMCLPSIYLTTSHYFIFTLLSSPFFVIFLSPTTPISREQNERVRSKRERERGRNDSVVHSPGKCERLCARVVDVYKRRIETAHYAPRSFSSPFFQIASR